MLYLSILSGLFAIVGYFTVFSIASPPGCFPRRQQATGTLDSFIALESPIALQGVLDNIGDAGSKVSGADSGLVIASPSKADPDCKPVPMPSHCLSRALLVFGAT